MNELIRRCKEGDREAFHELFETYGEMIQRISLRMTRKPEYLADIFQEVVARVIQGIGRFREDAQPSTWLYRITVNVNLDLLAREKARKDSVPLEAVAESRESDDPSPLEHAEKKQLFDKARMAIANLPGQFQEVLSLYYFADRDIREIAVHTKKTESAIKSILFKGRKAIVKTLRDQKVIV